MFRASSIATLGVLTGFLIAATIATTGWAAESPKIKRGQWPSVEIDPSTVKEGEVKAAQPQAIPERQAPMQLSPAARIEALGGLSVSRDGKTGTIGAAKRVKRLFLSKGKGGALMQAPRPGKLVRIKNTAQYPYTAVGLLANGCTGTLIGKRFVITQAFCLYDPKTKAWDQNLDFYAALDGKKMPYEMVKWKNAWVPVGFAEQGNLDYSFGLIELDSDLGDKTGWFGYGHLPDLPKLPTLTGYPAGVADFTMWETACSTKSAENAFFVYGCPLKKPLQGAPGAPVWMISQDFNGPFLVGLHGGSIKSDYWAQRLNEEAYYTLQAWMKQAEGGGEDAEEDDSGDDTDDESGDDSADDSGDDSEDDDSDEEESAAPQTTP